MTELSAEEILAITRPEDLFDAETIKAVFFRLRFRWHPDVCQHPRAAEVVHHITKLKDLADRRIEAGLWQKKREIVFQTSTSRFSFKYQRVSTIAVGKMYVAKRYVLFLLDEEHEGLYRAGIQIISGFPFRDDRLREEFRQYLPAIKFREKTDQGFALVIEKEPTVYPLSYVIAYLGGRIDPRQISWIGGNILKLSSLIEVCGYTHNGLTSDAIFIQPETGEVFLYGGWWFSVRKGDQLTAVPAKMRMILPRKAITEGLSRPEYDFCQVKATLIEALGDPTMLGTSVLLDSTVPGDLLDWLRADHSTWSSLKRFESWFEVWERIYRGEKCEEMIVSEKIYEETEVDF